MNLISHFIRRLFCRHREFSFVRNVYGDEIIVLGWKRSVWRCTACGKIEDRDHLHDDGDLRGVVGPLPEQGWD